MRNKGMNNNEWQDYPDEDAVVSPESQDYKRNEYDNSKIEIGVRNLEEIIMPG